MSNTILTPTAVTRKALEILHNNLVMAKRVNRQYDSSFAKSGARIGDSLKIRLPNEYTIRTGATLDAQDTSETSVTLQVATQKGVDMLFSSAELTMDLDDFADRILRPAMARLASEIDRDGLALYSDVYNAVGTSATTPATALVCLQAGQKLDEMAAPRDGNRHIVFNPAAQAAIVNALTGLFQSSEKIKQQYETGQMGHGLGFNFWMSQNVNSLTCGTRDTGTVVDGTLSTEGGTTITLDGCTMTTTVKAGEVFTVADCYAVNPETKESTGALMQFVVTEDATGDGTDLDLTFEPAIYTSASGVLQNVDSFPEDGKTVLFMGNADNDTSAGKTLPQNLAFHRDAFCLATADLEMPKGVDFSAREVFDGISIRIVRQYDINNDQFPCRLDVLYGWKTLRANQACRIYG